MNNTSVSTTAVASVQPVINCNPSSGVLKLALDVHLLEHVVAMQYDGSSPKPPQRFRPRDLLTWVQKQIAQGWKIVSCYEAGPFGYGLHRQLTALGVTNYVIRPRNWDEEHKRVKTDRTDARSMLTALDRFVAGNPHALALVRVPTEAQERARSQSRLRQSLRRDLKRIAQRGRGLALHYGYRLKGCWYGPRSWPPLPLPDWRVQLLAPLHAAANALRHLLAEQTARIEAQSTQPRPKGLGKLTEQLIARELCDPQRFRNRRQSLQLLGLVSRGTQLRPAPTARQPYQDRQSPVTLGVVRGGLASGALPARLPPLPEVARPNP